MIISMVINSSAFLNTSKNKTKGSYNQLFLLKSLLKIDADNRRFINKLCIQPIKDYIYLDHLIILVQIEHLYYSLSYYILKIDLFLY